MGKRNQFTFYRPYYDLIRELPAEQAKDIVVAMAAYALDGEEIELRGVTKGIFAVIKSDLDSGNRKACARQSGKKTEQTVKIDEQDGKKTKEETEKTKRKEKAPSHSPPPGGVKAQFSPGFDQFWTIYPKKTGKQAAWKSWSKQKCEPLTEVIISAVNRQKTWNSWTKDEGQYIPNPATWLNQGRWEDEPPEQLHQAVSQKRTASDQWAFLTDGDF